MMAPTLQQCLGIRGEAQLTLGSPKPSALLGGTQANRGHAHASLHHQWEWPSRNGPGALGLGQLRGLPGQLLSLLLFFFLLLGRCEALSISQVVHSNGQEHIQ